MGVRETENHAVIRCNLKEWCIVKITPAVTLETFNILFKLSEGHVLLIFKGLSRISLLCVLGLADQALEFSEMA